MNVIRLITILYELLLLSFFQTKVRPPGPSSGKMPTIRPGMSQVAIAPGGNKVVVHQTPQNRLPQNRLPQPLPTAQRLPQPTHTQIQTVRPKIASPRASTPSFTPKPRQIFTPTPIKQEVSSPAPREKRKFESLK